MSQIRYYMDEDSQHRGLVRELRRRSVDVLTAWDAGLSGQDDDIHLAFAHREGRVLYSCNTSDFCRLHAEWLRQGREHSGIIVMPRQRHPVGEQLRRLLHVVHTKSAEDMKNELLFI